MMRRAGCLSVLVWVSVCSGASAGLLQLSDNSFNKNVLLSDCFFLFLVFQHCVMCVPQLSKVFCVARFFMCNCVSYCWERECLDSTVRHSGWVLNINVGPPELGKYRKVQIVSWVKWRIIPAKGLFLIHKLRNSASSFHWLSSSIFSYCLFVVPHR